jgi:hypothetical protein
MKLLEHIEKHEKKVSGIDWASTGLGLCAVPLVLACIIQRGHPHNLIRMGVAIGFLVASVLVEHGSDEVLEQWERAVKYKEEFDKDYVRRETVKHGLLRDIELADNTYAGTPEDRWELIEERLGIAPPNFASRQPREVVQAVAEPPVQTPLDDIEDIDPAADFELDVWDEQTESTSQAFSFVPADDVPTWISHQGDNCPKSLIQEWQSNPGRGIQITGTRAIVVRG